MWDSGTGETGPCLEIDPDPECPIHCQVQVKLPYGLTTKDLVLDPSTHTTRFTTLDANLENLVQRIRTGDASYEMIERIFRSTVALKTQGHTIQDSLDTALVWEFG
jgi:hypothetical protein